MIGRAEVRTSLLQRRYSHQNLLGLLRRPHEPYSVRSQLWRLSAPSRTRVQTQQHLAEKQGRQWHQHRLVFKYVKKGDTHLFVYMFIRLSFHVGAHLRRRSWLILSSRCCKIWWAKRWRRWKASTRQGCSRMAKTAHTLSSSREMPPLTPLYQYSQAHEKNRIKTKTHLARTCSCSRMRVEILTRIQAPLIPSFTLLSSLLFLIWLKRLMTFVSWRHPAPDKRSGRSHL